MKYIEAPHEYEHENNLRLFLAGGITGCPDWQTPLVEALRGQNVTIFNPRRVNWPIHDPEASKGQIAWEYKYLRKADIILFWFPNDTLCPITLFELGAWSMTQKPVYIGVEPGYEREIDIRIQMQHRRPEIEVVSSLEELTEQIKHALNA